MIEILPAADHVAAFRLSGTLIEEDLDAIIADVEARLSRHDKVGVVADLTAFHDIGLRATIKDLRYSFGKILEWRRFPREAIITDRNWIRTAIAVLNPFIPFVMVKIFAPDEAEAAFAWAGDFEPGLRVAEAA